MSPDPDIELNKVRTLALELSQAAERRSHDAPAVHIENGRFFAYFWHNGHGDGATVEVVKMSGRDEQKMLIGIDPDCYFKSAYLGPSGWIAMRVGRDVTIWDHIADRIAQSWELVAPRHLLEPGGR